MTTDFRALCAELLDEVVARPLILDRELIARAHAALADEPAVPEGREPVSVTGQPSDEELALIYHDCCRGCEFMDQGGFENAARAVLARWGNPAPQPPAEGKVEELVALLRAEAKDDMLILTPADLRRAADLLQRLSPPQPVPVSERLPGPKDCDAEHYCWRWNTIGGLWARQPLTRSWYEFESHWLPAHALPVPEVK